MTGGGDGQTIPVKGIEHTDQIPFCLYPSVTPRLSTESEQMLHCVPDTLRSGRIESSGEC